jgi:hypothetical protein
VMGISVLGDNEKLHTVCRRPTACEQYETVNERVTA